MRPASLAWLLLGVSLLFSAAGHCENGCPNGMIPANGTNINSCVPVPPGYYGTQHPADRPLPPTPQWARRWGAIATDGVKGSLGAVTDMPDRGDAEGAALAECQTNGGAKCKVDVAYDNECVAMAVGDAGYSVNSDITLNAAIQLATKTCSTDGNTNCRVYYSACSLPKRVQ